MNVAVPLERGALLLAGDELRGGVDVQAEPGQGLDHLADELRTHALQVGVLFCLDDVGEGVDGTDVDVVGEQVDERLLHLLDASQHLHLAGRSCVLDDHGDEGDEHADERPGSGQRQLVRGLECADRKRRLDLLVLDGQRGLRGRGLLACCDHVVLLG